MSEVERVARLLCRAYDGSDPDDMVHDEDCGGEYERWKLYATQAACLTAAGLTILPLEPDAATVDEVAVQMLMAERSISREDAAQQLDWMRKHMARAAYRAATKGVG